MPNTYLECRLCWNREELCSCDVPDWEEHCELEKGEHCHDGRHWFLLGGVTRDHLHSKPCPLPGQTKGETHGTNNG